MSNVMFRSEVELGKLLGSVDIIPEAYQAISETNLTYELHTTRSGYQVLAFNCSSDDTTRLLNGEYFDLVSSHELQLVDFIRTKVNSIFSINKTAVELFEQLGDDLKELENKFKNTSLIITGSDLGGYLAVLSTLRLHHAVDVDEASGNNKTKRPICITFGCPLVGDAALQSAIAERPRWRSSFVNVVAKKDPVASLFSSDTTYKPFGTFLICAESGGHAAFEDQDSIMQVLDVMKSSNAGNVEAYDYTNVLKDIRRKVLCRGGFEMGEFNLNSLKAGITLQLREIGVLGDISNHQIGEIEKKQTEAIRKKNRANTYDPTKSLNDNKISLTFMEWYMKTRKPKGGYYDSYKNEETREGIMSQQEILKHQRGLNRYWKKIVEDKNRMPQTEGAKLRKRWLFGGTNYRRIVEPLDIARYYYKEKKVNYIENRPGHYKLLEEWYNDSNSSVVTRNKAASLTEDSCFWAYVEEASILLRNIEKGDSSIIQKELEQFEGYVMRAIKDK